jgi:hypothetical protein
MDITKNLKKSPSYAIFYMDGQLVKVHEKNDPKGPSGLQLLAGHLAANPTVYKELNRQINQLRAMQKQKGNG